MARILLLPFIFSVVLCLQGCGAKPENIIEIYLQKTWAYDIAGAKAMCTGGARDALGNLHEDLATDRVFAVGEVAADPGARMSWEEFRSTFDIVLYGKDKKTAMVSVITADEEILFTLNSIGGRWVIAGNTNPRFGLPGEHR